MQLNICELFMEKILYEDYRAIKPVLRLSMGFTSIYSS